MNEVAVRVGEQEWVMDQGDAALVRALVVRLLGTVQRELFYVEVTDAGPRKIMAIKAIRAITDISIREAKEMLDLVAVKPLTLGPFTQEKLADVVRELDECNVAYRGGREGALKGLARVGRVHQIMDECRGAAGEAGT